MIQIVVCDDNTIELHHIQQMMEAFFKQSSDMDYSIKTFASPEALIEAAKQGESFQICMLNILMPGQDGLSLGEQLQSMNSELILIYLSSPSDYILKPFHVYAFQYLLKPLKKDEFFIVMDRALMILNHQEDGYFIIKTKEGLRTLSCRQISYIEYRNHLIYIHMTDASFYESITLRKSFPDTVTDLFQYHFFVKPHKSYLVNLYHVQILQKTDFKMKDNTLIPISRNNYAEMKKEYIDFLINLDEDIKNGVI